MAIGLAVIASAIAAFMFIPVPVESAKVIARPMPMTVYGPGLLEAKVAIGASSRVQARIARLAVDEGQSVAAGDVIAELALADLDAELRRARLDVDAAHAAVAEAESRLPGTTAALSAARADFERKSELFRRGVGNQAAVDATRSAFEQGKANEEQAKATLERARAQFESAKAGVRVIEAKLSDGIVRAPTAGVVVSREHSAGDILVPGQSIAVIVDPLSLVVSARLDESVMGAVAPGQSASVRFVSTGDDVYPGRVVRLGRTVDATTREFRVDVKLERLPQHWAVGQRATVSVSTNIVKPDAIAIERRFLESRKDETGVWIENDWGRARWRPVKLGRANGNIVEIKEGLVPGQTLITGPQLFAFARIAT